MDTDSAVVVVWRSAFLSCLLPSSLSPSVTWSFRLVVLQQGLNQPHYTSAALTCNFCFSLVRLVFITQTRVHHVSRSFSHTSFLYDNHPHHTPRARTLSGIGSGPKHDQRLLAPSTLLAAACFLPGFQNLPLGILITCITRGYLEELRTEITAENASFSVSRQYFCVK
jgi:hypothetical protein